jgi:YesN/AraC family two-component response regulator
MNQAQEVCGEAENGHEGMELAKRLKPDIVLLDYSY